MQQSFMKGLNQITKSKNKLFLFLYANFVILVVYSVLFDKETVAMSMPVIFLNYIGSISGIIAFFWMFSHCIKNVLLRNKFIWVFLFIIGTVFTAGVYYFLIYRKYNSGKDIFVDKLIKKQL